MNKRNLIPSTLSFATIILLVGSALEAVALSPISIQSVVAETNSSAANTAITTATSTPIKHLIVIFQENISFDHYFGTYPYAKNPLGEHSFLALPDTPSINGLTKALLNNNTNLVDPFRMDKQDAKMVASCDNNHTYTAIQKSYNGGLMDKFVESSGIIRDNCNPNQVMGYFDGNTVTALWNYAQHFAMSDNYYQTVFGHSTPGHINLVSGQTHGVIPAKHIPDKVSNGTLIGDLDPKYDGCSSSTGKYFPTVSLSGRNVGNLLNNKGVTWGWFQGGFKPTSRAGGKLVCGSAHKNIHHDKVTDYVAHHEPFQYYRSTANPKHLPPSSTAMIGKTDQANHQYDLSDFWRAADSGHLPAVSFLKAPAYQDGHAGYSDPLYEQHFLVNTINHLQKLPSWKSTAIIITKDDSGGWYDHQMGPIVNYSSDPKYDFLSGL